MKHGSPARFSLSASQAIPVTCSASLSYCFAYRMQIRLDDRQESLLPHHKARLSFLKKSIAYLGVQTQDPAARFEHSNKNLQEAQDFPSQVGACWDPTQQHRAASDYSKSHSAVTSSQGLFQQLGLARVHSLASAPSQECFPP